MVQALPIIQIDAFTTTAFEGNPCAVVFDADGLSATAMQTIAREMNLSETAFVLESERADLRARYFTPAEEIPLAGHPTIATIHGLLSTGRLPRNGGTRRLTLELQAGVIEVEVADDAEGRPLITMTQPGPRFLREHDPAEVLPVFGLKPEDLQPGVPITTVSTGTPQLMVPLRGIAALRRVAVDQAGLQELRAGADFVSTHLFVSEGATDAGATFARHFASPPGFFEDPFTASATGGMAAYLWRHGRIASASFTAEQGHWMRRPGRAEVEVLGPPEAITGVRVGGYAVEVMEGMLLAPA